MNFSDWVLLLAMEVAETSYEWDFVVIQASLHEFLVAFGGCGSFGIEFVVVSHNLGEKREKIRISCFGIRGNERDSSTFPKLFPMSTYVRHTWALTVSLKRLADGGD